MSQLRESMFFPPLSCQSRFEHVIDVELFDSGWLPSDTETAGDAREFFHSKRW